MARATTAAFHQMFLEVETSSPGTYARICGLVGTSFTFTTNTAETETPDCDDESLPHVLTRTGTTIDWSASGTGVWASQSHEMIKQWWLTAATKNVRLVYSSAATGDIEYIAGPAILTSHGNERVKGEQVSMSIELVSAGAVTTTDQT
jgi:predicted secreted protein